MPTRDTRSTQAIHAGLAMLALTASSIATGQSLNPFDADPGAISAGAIMFGNRCAECHGADAKGLIGSDLTGLWQSGVEDERVFRTIRDGVANTVMPPSSAADKEIWAIITYLKSISTVPPFTSASGDPERGRALFAAHCASCHHAREAGGSLGPDLSRIARVRSREALVSAIREPDMLVAADHRTVRLTLRDGAEVSGIRRAEDAFSIQVLSAQEQLLGFNKSELADVRREPYSLMPAFGTEQLDAGELEDLLAYMATLR